MLTGIFFHYCLQMYGQINVISLVKYQNGFSPLEDDNKGLRVTVLERHDIYLKILFCFHP